jgi:hypothetical protein
MSAIVAIASDVQSPANLNGGQHRPHSEAHGSFAFSFSLSFSNSSATFNHLPYCFMFFLI